MFSYLIPLTLTLAACFGLQSIALRAVGGRTEKSESNFFSSIGRIQAGAQGHVDVMVLGSSITGRLPDRAQGVPGVANMGCDGGSAVDALRAMDVGILPTAPCIILEANTLQLALDEKPTEIGRAMKRPWFKVGLKTSGLSAYARPSAFFYSKLLARRTGGFGSIEPGADLEVSSRPEAVTNNTSVALTARQDELIGEISAILGRLRTKGCRTMIVWLPPARRDGSAPPPWILEMAHQSQIPYWDLGQEAAPGTVTLTDGVHMAAPSAARTMVSLMKAISER
ncbi:MAG: hypothetical protein ABI162_01600 [Luteolibacter sp.]